MKTKLEIADIKAKIADLDYHVFPNTTVTVCLMTLQNGFTVIGESACVDPNNFDAEVGQHWAYEDALRKIWKLEGYLLKEQHYASGN